MSETLSYQGIRGAHQAREAHESMMEARKKNLLILVLHYLDLEGYQESSETLSRETNINLSHYAVADNVDLETVLTDYESYYHVKFGKPPTITKKIVADTAVNGKSKRPSGIRRDNSSDGSRKSGQTTSLPRLPSTPPTMTANGRPRSSKGRPPPTGGPSAKQEHRQDKHKNGPSSVSSESDALQLGLQGLVINGNGNATNGNASASENGEKPAARAKVGQIIDFRSMISQATRLNAEEGTRSDPSDRLLKPLGGYSEYTGEWREMAQIITRDIFAENPNVKWSDIVGLESAKEVVKESVVYPIKYPALFQDILAPWKGLLLYGPPGTGKTLLAKAIATECNTTFFNISASTIVSKWRGDSEKLVRVLFEMARYHAPSTIFLDELESIMSQRGGGGGEHEGSRRMKTELLVQMDGLSKSDDLVFLLAASNLPWELDIAMLRRLEKRILVALPTLEARRVMFHNHLPPERQLSGSGLTFKAELDYDILASKTEGYSGSDIHTVCKEAAYRSMRKVIKVLESDQGGPGDVHIKIDPVTTEDVLAALKHSKASAGASAKQYLDFQKQYESV